MPIEFYQAGELSDDLFVFPNKEQPENHEEVNQKFVEIFNKSTKEDEGQLKPLKREEAPPLKKRPSTDQEVIKSFETLQLSLDDEKRQLNTEIKSCERLVCEQNGDERVKTYETITRIKLRIKNIDTDKGKWSEALSVLLNSRKNNIKK